MTGVAELLDLLRCPVCQTSLEAGGSGVRCTRGHHFDVARQGYLNLLQSSPPRHADTAGMVAARERFLAGGHYRAVADGLVEAVLGGLSPQTTERGRAVLEAGAGTGYYLAALLDRVPGRGLALDISVAAARRAARAHPRVASVVADTWRRLPVGDGQLDVVLSVFAPRHAAEFARVLTPDGLLAVVTPLPDHLVELRAALDLLDVEEDKQQRLAAALQPWFRSVGERSVQRQDAWPASVVLDLVAMGPNAFHLDAGARAARVGRLAAPVRVSVAVSITTWRPAPGPAAGR